MNCEGLGEVAAEFALGALTGEQRAAAIVHLERCGHCRAEVSALADAADLLLLAAPRVDPPPGFEVRVLGLLEAERAGRTDGQESDVESVDRGAEGRPTLRGWSARAVGIAVAASLMVVAGPRGDLGEAASAEVQSVTGATIGRAVIDGGSITMEMPGWSAAGYPYAPEAGGRYRLVVRRGDGSSVVYDLSSSSATTWSAGLGGTDADDVARVEVVDAEQRVWCSATFA